MKKRIKKSIRNILFLTFCLIPLLSEAQNIYVSPAGDDANSGGFSDPLATIQSAIDMLDPGDTIFLRGGSYHEEIVMQSKKGSSSNPMVFKAYGNELPIIDGSVDLEDIKTDGAAWELATDVFPGTGNIYKLSLDEDIWQLWVRQPELMAVPNATGGERADYRMQVIARWPDGRTNPTDPLIKGPDGISAKVNTWWSFTTTWAFASHPETSHTKLVNSQERFNLAGTEKSFQGGTAVISAIKQGPANFPVQILEHQAGSNEIIHSGISESYGLYTYPSSLGPSYFIQHLNALDSPGEWYYDDDSKTVYLWPEDNSDPNTLDIRGKTQTYGFELLNCEHIVFDGISLFGTSMKLDGDYISFINGAVSYPDMPKTLLGFSGIVIPAIYANDCSNFTMRNCIVEYSQSSIIQVKNVGSIFDNNYFHHLGMTGMGASGSFHNVNTFTNNTIRTVGNRAAVKANSDPQSGRNQSWNILDGWGFLYANDGVGFQSSQGGSVNSVRAYNWFLKSNRSGHRYDGPEEGKGFPTLGLSHHLVSLRGVSVSTTIKGDYNQLYNYLGILSSNENGDIAVRWNLETGEGNRNTIMRNCAAEGINIGKWNPLPCINSNNWDASKKGGSMLDFHPEADLLDFRPKAGAPLINAGYHVPGITDGYLGPAPDIGAYEWGDDSYWIPGYKTANTSWPIPYDEAQGMKLDRDLIFAHAYQSDKAVVYFGTNEAAVQSASEATAKAPGLANIEGGDVVVISLDSGRNIVTPTMLLGNPNAYDPAPYLLVDDPHITLKPNTSYYWRADAISGSGGVTTGDTWSFTTGDQTQLVQLMIYADDGESIIPAACVDVLIGNSMYKTDSAGFIYGVRFPEGNYTYIISKKGYTSIPGSFSLVADTLISDTIVWENYSVDIKVLDEDMGTPVEGALIQMGEYSMSTDALGEVAIEQVDYGIYPVSISAEEFIPFESIEIEIYSDTSLTLYIVKDYRKGSFTILDMYDDTPIHRAVMTSRQGETVLTNEEGEVFMSKVTPGWWEYTIEHADYFSMNDSVFVEQDTIIAEIRLARNKANVSMVINDSEGPIADASIILGNYNSQSTREGMAWFFFLPARETYDYSVEKESFESVNGSLFLEVDTILEVFLEPVHTETMLPKDLCIYPNPVNSQLHIEYMQEFDELRILQMDGRILIIKNLQEGTTQVDVSGLPAGMYLLEFNNRSRSVQYKIVKS